MPKPAEKKPKPAAKRARKPSTNSAANSAQVTKPENGSLVPSPTGRGMLRHGSKKGNTPGPGRPPSAIREALRASFDKRITILEEIADGGEQDSDRLKAVDILAKYGLGKDVSVEDVKSRLAQTLDIIDEECDGERAARIRERLRPVWR
jgi:hypothetical protein